MKSNGKVLAANMTEPKEVFCGSGSPRGFPRERSTGRTTMNATMIHGLKMKNLLIILMMKKKRTEAEKRRLV